MKKMRSILHEILDNDLSSGELIRGKRIEAGLSQEDLQEITGVARSNISALENGRLEMTPHYALLFAAVFKMHPQEILYPNGKFAHTSEFKAVQEKAKVVSKRRAI